MRTIGRNTLGFSKKLLLEGSKLFIGLLLYMTFKVGTDRV